MLTVPRCRRCGEAGRRQALSRCRTFCATYLAGPPVGCPPAPIEDGSPRWSWARGGGSHPPWGPGGRRAGREGWCRGRPWPPPGAGKPRLPGSAHRSPAAAGRGRTRAGASRPAAWPPAGRGLQASLAARASTRLGERAWPAAAGSPRAAAGASRAGRPDPPGPGRPTPTGGCLLAGPAGTRPPCLRPLPVARPRRPPPAPPPAAPALARPRPWPPAPPQVRVLVGHRHQQPRSAQLQPQLHDRAGMGHGVGDQLAGHQRGRLAQLLKPPAATHLAHEAPPSPGHGRRRSQQQPLGQPRRPGAGVGQRRLQAGMDRHLPGHPVAQEDVGHRRLGAHSTRIVLGQPRVGCRMEVNTPAHSGSTASTWARSQTMAEGCWARCLRMALWSWGRRPGRGARPGSAPSSRPGWRA
jgi:hypothetical protein